MWDLFLIELVVTKVKPYTNSIEVHPQLNNNKHTIDDLLVGVGSLWPMRCNALGSHCENLCSDLHQCSVFFTSKFSPIVDLKNMILTYIKVFFLL